MITLLYVHRNINKKSDRIRPLFIILHFLPKRIRLIGIEYLITSHNSHQILSIREINYIMRPARNHIKSIYLVAQHFEFNRFTGVDVTLLSQSMSSYNDKYLPLGIMPMLSLSLARLIDINRDLRTNSVNEPLSSELVLSEYLILSVGRYAKYRLYNFFANEPSGIFGIIKVVGCSLNSSSKSTIAPSVTLCVKGTQSKRILPKNSSLS